MTGVGAPVETTPWTQIARPRRARRGCSPGRLGSTRFGALRRRAGLRERIRSEAAFARLCGACPVPASSGKTTRHRLNRGGNRRANAALYRVVVTRMRGHRPTLDYVRRRTAEGKGKAEIIRCLKRFVAREIYGYLCRGQGPSSASSCPA